MIPNNVNLPFVEDLYAQFQRDPASVAPEWRRYFEQLGNGDAPLIKLRPSFRPRSIFNPPAPGGDGPGEPAALQDRVQRLIRAYRVRGHLVAKVDPLGQPRMRPPEIEPEFYGFTPAAMDKKFSAKSIFCDEPLTLRHIIERMQNTYCRTIGVQFMHIDNFTIRRWLQERMERTQNRLKLSRDEQVRILTRLTDAVVFEEFIRKKFVGAKSFSLEGAESLIPLLDLAIEKAGDDGVEEIALGMAHRGRLNVLVNIIGKSPREIFREFEDKDPEQFAGGGDVKYHLGYSNDWITSSRRKVHLSLCFNPSHLEFVNPVALGRVRAKQDRAGDAKHERAMALLIHGDASFAGQGVIQETLNLSQLPAYATGGTLHVLVNNQIGFTTSPGEGRTTLYATSVAKMLGSPIFHVNGEDPEAVAECVRVAMDFRRTFKRDVIIDMYCYRRLGHNEGDEPSFTQPVLYRAIEQRKSVREGYLEHMLKLGGVTQEEADEIAKGRRELLERELSEARSETFRLMPDTLHGVWAGYVGGPESSAADVDTGVPKEQLARLLEAQTKMPADFHLHPKLNKALETRRAMAVGERPLDWSAAEALAFASIAADGFRVRMSGQDTERGTFSQRHATLHDYEDGREYVPLRNLGVKQAPVQIFNSPLSEVGVLGFEYGYSLDCPDGLVLWEAQFGDFVNVAQPILDQFITSAEDKWRRLSGLVLLLPHGFEGQGPEHSSARLERFLNSCAEDNMQVIYPSTPAQYFHALRRQVVRRWRKPLVVMTPKSLLRHPRSVSSLDECAAGQFQRIIGDAQVQQPRRVLLCSGKIYHELLQERERLKRDDVAIVRIEQFYPLATDALRAVITAPAVWVQEEPENMGAWRFLRTQFCGEMFGQPFRGIYRPASASPATGSAAAHKLEQQELLQQAFTE
jgi:2-oxoglutarate dehydrogenase E1 component